MGFKILEDTDASPSLKVDKVIEDALKYITLQ